MAKKALYIFLTSLLGVLLFLILDRVVVFFYLYLLAGGYITTGMDYYQYLALDYFSLVIIMMLGAWYGVWLGLSWYARVYEEKSHGGLVHHISTKYFQGRKPKDMESKMASIKQRLETDMWELEKLAKPTQTMAETFKPAPIKRKVVRKAAPKKLKSLK
jgi:hypothetical protein